MKNNIRIRLRPYSVMVFLVWPAFAVLMAAVEFRNLPYYAVSWSLAFLASVAGAILLVPDFLIAGILTGGVVLVAFAIMSESKSKAHFCGLLEPLLVFISGFLWTMIFYPAVTSMRLFAVFHEVPYFAAVLIVAGIVALGSFALGRSGTWHRVLIVVLTIGSLLPMAAWLRTQVDLQDIRRRPPLVLLGLDSLSQQDDLTLLKLWTAKHGGTWYSKPVPPGLLTNSVWTSLLTERYVNDHGVFHVFQSIPEKEANAGLIAQAKKLGYWTVSYFPDQLTCWVGSKLPFDENRSGPLGWRQLAVSFVSNASIVLPLTRPLLPEISVSAAPRNQAGTFTYDLDRDLRDILTTGHPFKRTFVVAHTTYLHSPVYPRADELSWDEWKLILGARVKFLRDRGLDWQDVDLPQDPVRIREWKVRRLQEAVARGLVETRFLERGGRILLLSDHGHRAGLSVNNFMDERYHHVILVSFGLSSKDHEEPISLLDIGSLLELREGTEKFQPIVQFTIANPLQWPTIAKTARPRFDGTIELDQSLLKSIFKGLRTHRPWPPGSE